MIEFMVIDLQTEIIDPTPQTIVALSPEHAVELKLGVSLVRSGAKQDLRARVYSPQPGQPMTMVRLYTKAADRRPREIANDP